MGILADVHFAYQPMGIYDLSSLTQEQVNAAKSTDDAYVTGAVSDITETFTVKGDVAMGYTLFTSSAGPSATIFTNKTDTATFGADMVASLYTWKEGGAIKTNVASRMMQKEALHHAQSASFIAIIIVQWADLVICYIGPITIALGTRPLRFTHWTTGIPFSIFIFLYDEARKYLMRRTSFATTDKETGRTMRFPGWLERNTYY